MQKLLLCALTSLLIFLGAFAQAARSVHRAAPFKAHLAVASAPAASLIVPAPILSIFPINVPTTGLIPSEEDTALSVAVGAQQALHGPASPTDTLSALYDRANAPVGPQAVSVPPPQAPTGKALFDELHQITGRGYKTHNWRKAQDYLFSTADQVVVNGKSGIIDAYSSVFVPGRSSEGGDYPEPGDSNGDGHRDTRGMNVEHIWPQSFFGKRLPMRSDLHHLLTTFIHPNAIRDTLPFGEVKGRGDYSNKAGAKRGQGVFEPPDAAKGQVARAMLYFYTRYHNINITIGDYNDQTFWNGKLEMLLRWNKQFPPDKKERRRNDLVENFQGNRNPFVDDPTLADRIGVEGFWRLPKAQRIQLRQSAGQTVSPRKHRRRHR